MRSVTSILLVLVTACWLSHGMAEVLVVVSRDSPVSTMPRSHLADLYLGRADRFPDGKLAVPLDLNERLTPWSDFYERYLDRTPAQIRAHWSRQIFTGRGRPPRALGSPEAMLEALAADPHTIGYLPAAQVDERLRVVIVE